MDDTMLIPSIVCKVLEGLLSVVQHGMHLCTSLYLPLAIIAVWSQTFLVLSFDGLQKPQQECWRLLPFLVLESCMPKLTLWDLQTQVSHFALEFVKTRELKERLETAESNLVVLAKAHTAAQDQLLVLSSQSSMPYQARCDPCQPFLSCMSAI